MRFSWLGILALASCAGGRIDVGDSDACEPAPFHADVDLDGYGAIDVVVEACEPPAGFVRDGGDCDDADATVWPGALERCDGQDDDCDGLVDEDAAEAVEYFGDEDMDGFGGASMGVGCLPGPGYTTVGGDCDDADPSVFPGADDVYDGVDADCDGTPELVEFVEVEALGTLGYVYDDWQQRPPAEPALRAFGVYRAKPGAPITVDVQTAQPTALVLVSYEATDWVVTETWPGTVQEVIVSAYEGVGAISAPSGATITRASLGHFRDIRAPERFGLEAALGREIASAHGVHAAMRFEVRPLATLPAYPQWPECDAYVPSTSPAGEPDTTVPRSACPTETSESAWCVVTGQLGQLSVVGLDSFSQCDLGLSFDTRTSSGAPTSLAWIGDDVFGCVGDYDILQRVPLDGSEAQPDHAPVWCDAAVAHGGELIVVPDASLGLADHDTLAWSSWEDAQCGAPSREWNVGWRGGSLAAKDGIGYASSSRPTSVDLYDLAGGAGWTSSVALPASDDRVNAIAVVGDRLVQSMSRSLRVLDLGDGTLLAEGGTGALGLYCVEN